jgi:hypothetical protein
MGMSAACCLLAQSVADEGVSQTGRQQLTMTAAEGHPLQRVRGCWRAPPAGLKWYMNCQGGQSSC